MVCGNFILPEPASYVFFYAIFNLRKLFYLIYHSAPPREALYSSVKQSGKFIPFRERISLVKNKEKIVQVSPLPF